MCVGYVVADQSSSNDTSISVHDQGDKSKGQDGSRELAFSCLSQQIWSLAVFDGAGMFRKNRLFCFYGQFCEQRGGHFILENLPLMIRAYRQRDSSKASLLSLNQRASLYEISAPKY